MIDMRWMLVALLSAGSPWAADDDEAPPRTASSEPSLRVKSRRELLAGAILSPIGVVAITGGAISLGFGIAPRSEAPLACSSTGCSIDRGPQLLAGVGGAFFVAGVGLLAAGIVCAMAGRLHRRQANPWLATVRF